MNKVHSIGAFKCIRDTGAVAGDWVECTSTTDDQRYTKGKQYQVFDHFNRPHAFSDQFVKVTDAGARRGIRPYQFPMEGVGATWRKVVGADET